jgi:hypothetical protein
MMMNEFECATCGAKAGSSNADETQCMSCRDDAQHPDRPWCERCGKHRCTASQKAFDAGERRCRGCYQDDFENGVQADYYPVLSLVEEFTGFTGYVEQTGGNTMVAKVYLPASETNGWCQVCSEQIEVLEGSWVHSETENTRCAEGQGDYLPEEQRVATPQEGYPQIAFTYDTDDHWMVMYQEHWEDQDGFEGIDTEDLPSGSDENGNPVYGGEYATAEDVAARIILLAENIDYGRDSAYGPRPRHRTDYDISVYLNDTEMKRVANGPDRVVRGGLHESAYAVTAATTSALFSGKPEAGWTVSSYGAREVLGGGWFRLQIGVSTRADFALPTIDDVVAYVAATCPIFTVVRKA